MQPATTNEVKLTFGPTGPTEFTVNGRDALAEVSGIGCVIEEGKPAVVNVRLAPGVTSLTGAAVVNVLTDQSPSDVISKFLRGISPKAVEEYALANSGFADGSPIEIAMQYLIELAEQPSR